MTVSPDVLFTVTVFAEASTAVIEPLTRPAWVWAKAVAAIAPIEMSAKETDFMQFDLYDLRPETYDPSA